MGIASRRVPPQVSTPVQTVKQVYTFPSSTGGINSLDNVMQMPPEDCLYCHNIMPSEYGLRLRKGYRLWTDEIDGGNPVNTIIPFEGQAADASLDRLWAVTENGIWDVTIPDQVNPAQDVIFGVQIAGAGFGVWTEFTNDATDRYLQYADGKNGLWEYSEDSGLWSQPSLNGPDVDHIAFVTAWKNRLWYIEESSGDAWYLSPDSNSGSCTKFTFGSKFKHGGELKALYNWTIDGGEGVDDLLVAVSRGGDVLIYQGTDPATADGFGLVGSYFIGEIPETRQMGVGYGGELYLLSTYGLTSVRDLLQGVASGDAGKSPAAKISRSLRDAISVGKDALNWALRIHPTDGFLQLVGPYDEPSVAIQYNQNLLTRAWGMWRGAPVNCAETWNAKYYIGDKQGRVWLYDGAVDGKTFAGQNVWTDVSAGPAGPEWTQPLALQYLCDGTQTSDTPYNIVATQSTVLARTYLYSYTITGWVAGEHWVTFGSSTSAGPKSSGNGVFVGSFLADAASTTASVWGDVDFEGQFEDVSIRDAGDQGTPIDFDILTGFHAPNGDHSSNKRVGLIRTLGFIAGRASINVSAIYDYAIETEILLPPQLPVGGDNVWDGTLSKWDGTTWDYAAKGVSFPIGSSGIGRTVAIAMRGSADTRINIIGWDITYTQGGFL